MQDVDLWCGYGGFVNLVVIHFGIRFMTRVLVSQCCTESIGQAVLNGQLLQMLQLT